MELARNLKVESVGRLPPPPPLCLGRDASVADAVAAMRRHRGGCVLVRSGERLVGIFTERDFLRRVLAAGRPLSVALAECMTADPVSVRANETIGAALRRMEEGGYRHLPVVDGQGRPVGVVSVKCIVHYLVEHFPSTIHCLPPDPEAFPRRAEGA
jgi:CBS domain-containing protein